MFPQVGWHGEIEELVPQDWGEGLEEELVDIKDKNFHNMILHNQNEFCPEKNKKTC